MGCMVGLTISILYCSEYCSEYRMVVSHRINHESIKNTTKLILRFDSSIRGTRVQLYPKQIIFGIHSEILFVPWGAGVGCPVPEWGGWRGSSNKDIGSVIVEATDHQIRRGDTFVLHCRLASWHLRGRKDSRGTAHAHGDLPPAVLPTVRCSRWFRCGWMEAVSWKLTGLSFPVPAACAEMDYVDEIIVAFEYE